MRRVYVIWLFKKATSILAVEIYAFVGILSATFYHISFFNVMKNAFNGYSSLSALSAYFFNSFMTTDLISQFLILGAMAAFFLFNWEIFKNQFRTSQPL